ncbi:hypothetical protein [Cardinium endosymbiont of Sogatella furcifera]|uniref:hypothetical protein n=1 Tax=Cardinium endosymbiont of Sogatella furcifera TaxID=650378 RepID=UPI000E0D64BA|nr:hypothetical protein [Cardinium endosymbiont of Sogatella furcifera]MDN5246788.1 hypothetical protein [Candidatus Cardinium sp.]
MQKVTVSIINHKALRILKELASLQLIQLDSIHKKHKKPTSKSWITPFEGIMHKQPLEELDQQLQELRNG